MASGSCPSGWHARARVHLSASNCHWQADCGCHPLVVVTTQLQPRLLCSLGIVALSDQACWCPAGIKYMVCLCGLVLCFLASTILEAWLTREGLKGGRRGTAPVQPASHAQFDDLLSRHGKQALLLLGPVQQKESLQHKPSHQPAPHQGLSGLPCMLQAGHSTSQVHAWQLHCHFKVMCVPSACRYYSGDSATQQGAQAAVCPDCHISVGGRLCQ